MADVRGNNIIVAGPMGCGKTSVGRELARRLSMPFLDTDALIEAETRKTIREIFAERGEGEFRRLEREALSRAAKLQRTVVAIGGGALLDPDNRRLLRGAGLMVGLVASPEAILERTACDGTRPLLSGQTPEERRHRVEELLRERLPGLRECDFLLDTSEREVEACVEEILKLPGLPGCAGDNLRPRTPDGMISRVIVRPTSGGSYPILIGEGILSGCGHLINQELQGQFGRALVVTNSLVAQLYGETVSDSLKKAGFQVNLALLPDGEEYKTLESAAYLYDFMAEKGMDRSTLVIALGGGVIGDLAGFVASTYMRGVPLVQVPTTLLAQVDSSVGGKVGVNHRLAKNLIGAFYQPAMVVTDIRALYSLPEREYSEGLAEVVKYGLSLDGEFFGFLCDNASRIMARDPEVLRHIILRSCELKAEVIRKDEKESGYRMVLNFGHTVGHAVEAASGYGHLRHGEAVSIGMVVAMRIAERLGYFSREDALRAVGLLTQLGLPVKCEVGYDRILPHLSLDKKARSGRLRFVLPNGIGDAIITDAVEPEMVQEALLCL